MNRRKMLASAAAAAASTALPITLTAEEEVAYQDSLANHDVTYSTELEATWLWGRWFAIPDAEGAFPGMALAPKEYDDYKARLDRVIALAPDLLDAHRSSLRVYDHPVEKMDWSVMAFANALWDAGFRAGLCMEHTRLATLHRELSEPELKLK